MKANISIDASKAKRKMKKLEKMERPIGSVLTHFAGQVIKSMQRNATGKIVGKYKWGRKTGALGRSGSHKLDIQKGLCKLAVGTGVTTSSAASKYATILDKGGIIRAKRAPYLMIPMPDGSFRKKKEVRIPEFRWFRESVKENLSILDRFKFKKSVLKKMGL